MSDSTHKTHILPLSTYLGVATGLLIMTALTIWVAGIDFGPWNMVIALAIAAFKASLVALFFMHLIYDNRIYMVVFLTALLFLAVFIVLTMFDTSYRGAIYELQAAPINPHAIIYDNPSADDAANAVMLSDFQMEHGIGPFTETITLNPLDNSLATRGEEIFDIKCGTCHRMDERLVGPALRDITQRRTPEFILNMILNPEEMIKKHPVVQELLAQYYTKMTFQNVSQDDAMAILEFLRRVGAEQATM